MNPDSEIGPRPGPYGGGHRAEAAHATLEFALQDRGHGRVISIDRVGNDASRNVMRKLGMTPERETAHPAYGFPLCVHTIDLTEFAV